MVKRNILLPNCRNSTAVKPPKRTSYGVAAHHLRGAVGTKRRRTSGRERSCGNEFQRGCVAAFYGMHTGRSSGTPPLVRIRARHRCEFVWNRYVKAKAIAERRRKLRIPRFRPRAKSSLTPLLLLSPPNPLTLGFGGDPVLELGVSKEPWVLWRVFLCYLSSREERWHPRRALPAVERLDNSGVVTGFAY